MVQAQNLTGLWYIMYLLQLDICEDNMITDVLAVPRQLNRWLTDNAMCDKTISLGPGRFRWAKRLKWYRGKAQNRADRPTMWPHARLRAKTNWNVRIELFPLREYTELNMCWQDVEYKKIIYMWSIKQLALIYFTLIYHCRESLWKVENTGWLVCNALKINNVYANISGN